MRYQRLPKGMYMLLEDPEAFRGWLAVRRISYGDLGRMVGCSKQFISKLANGDKRTCTDELAQRIEQVLLPPPEMRTPRERNLFVPRGTPVAPVSRPYRRQPMPKGPARERFMRFVDQRGPDECWPWTGTILRANGYGQFRAEDGTQILAHRFAYATFVGLIGRGLVIDHVAERGCVRRDCVNPAHLEAVTMKENSQRGKQRNHIVHDVEGFCPEGHALAEVGVYHWRSSATGYRCAECERERSRRRYAEKKQRLANPTLSKVDVDNSPILSEGSATVTT